MKYWKIVRQIVEGLVGGVCCFYGKCR